MPSPSPIMQPSPAASRRPLPLGEAASVASGEGRGASSDVEGEASLVAALRAGDESAFVVLVDTYHARMLRMAGAYSNDRAVTEEIVQETWLRVLRSMERFESRSTLKTWMFRILINTAMNWATRERRSVAMSRLVDDDDWAGAVESERFRPDDAELWPGHWAAIPASWGSTPEARLLAGETRDRILAAIKALPPGQRTVVTMRDMEGWSAEEVCNALHISESNQRVLLHRGRSRVRRELERYFTGN
jgi:RNA polymerase sigma-70 factor (ECF subfamily)